MAFKGFLSDVPIEELLEWVQGSAKTGVLEIESERYRKQVWFVDGSIVMVESTAPMDSLCGHLERAGQLSPSQSRAAAQVHSSTGRSLFDILHHTGAVDTGALVSVFEEQAREALLAVFLWPEGRFVFRDGERAGGNSAGLGLDGLTMVPEGQRRRRWAGDVYAGLGGREARFCLAGSGAIAEQPVEAQVLRLLDRPQTVAGLMEETGLSEFVLLGQVQSLLEQGLLEIGGAGQAARGSAAAARRGRAGAADSAEGASSGSVAVLEPPAAPRQAGPGEPGGSGVLDILAAARREMSRRNYEEALDLFRSAVAVEPTDARLGELVRGAESVYCDVVYHRYLPPEARPARSAEPPTHGVPATALAARMLEQVDGVRSVRELVKTAGVAEADALRALNELRRSGHLVLAG